MTDSLKNPTRTQANGNDVDDYDDVMGDDCAHHRNASSVGAISSADRRAMFSASIAKMKDSVDRNVIIQAKEAVDQCFAELGANATPVIVKNLVYSEFSDDIISLGWISKRLRELKIEAKRTSRYASRRMYDHRSRRMSK